MKRRFLSALTVAVALCATANGLSIRDRAYLRSLGIQQELADRTPDNFRNIKTQALNRAKAGNLVTAMGRLEKGHTVAELEAEGIQVFGSSYGFVFMAMDKDAAPRVAQSRALKSFELSRPVQAKMSMSRAATGVDKIHQGLGLPQAYTGKGVIAGIVDEGFEPAHPNFRNADGTSRISTFTIASIVNNAVNLQSYDPETIFRLSSDNSDTYHGTHTLGILAGSYKGEVLAAMPVDNGEEGDQYKSTNETMASPYYGVAYDADLAVGAGSSYDALIAYNLENIISYADYKGERAVINLSLGSCSGTHDGRSTMSQYLDLLGYDGTITYTDDDGEEVEMQCPNAIICLSAGNEGDMEIALHKTFTEDDTDLKTFFSSNVTDKSTGLPMRAGAVEVYSDTDQKFALTIFIYNTTRNRIIWSETIEMDDMNEASTYFCSSDDWVEYDTDKTDSTLGKHFDGYMGFASTFDQDSGRYFGFVDFYLRNSSTNADDNYKVGFWVEGVEGQRVDCYEGAAYGYSYFTDYGIVGYDDGMRDGTINDMACGYNTIAVGAWNVRELWPAMDGQILSYGEGNFPQGEVTEYSSYGTLIDGRTLPHIVAPGATVISSSNGAYHRANKSDGGLDPYYLQATTEYDGQTYYYMQSMGTSMASPAVAGAIALWLEADPTLNVADIREIMKNTADQDEFTAKAVPAQVGYGKFNAYEGLKAVLRSSSVIPVTVDQEKKMVLTAMGDRQFEVFVPGLSSLDAKVYNMAGAQVAASHAGGDTMMMDVNNVMPGVYIINVNGVYSEKLVIK